MQSVTQQASASVLADIAPPPAPPPSPLVIGGWSLAVLLVIAIAATALRHRWFGRRARIRRRVRRIRRQLAGGQLPPREAAFRIAAVLRDGMQSRALNFALAPPCSDSHPEGAWQQFIGRLDAARFAPAPPSQGKVGELLAEAGRWLQCHP